MWFGQEFLIDLWDAIRETVIKWTVAIVFCCLLGGSILWFLVAKVNNGGIVEAMQGSAYDAPASSEALRDTSLKPVSYHTVRTAAASSQPAPPAPAVTTPPPVAVRSKVPGNPYAAGNCTWYAKQRRPDMPNNLGNAYTWVARARTDGLPTGNQPKPGAIGQRGDHVVYVDSLNANGTVNISEMNFIGYGRISHRTLPASTFNYIY